MKTKQIFFLLIIAITFMFLANFTKSQNTNDYRGIKIDSVIASKIDSIIPICRVRNKMTNEISEWGFSGSVYIERYLRSPVMRKQINSTAIILVVPEIDYSPNHEIPPIDLINQLREKFGKEFIKRTYCQSNENFFQMLYYFRYNKDYALTLELYWPKYSCSNPDTNSFLKDIRYDIFGYLTEKNQLKQDEIHALKMTQEQNDPKSEYNQDILGVIEESKIALRKIDSVFTFKPEKIKHQK